MNDKSNNMTVDTKDDTMEVSTSKYPVFFGDKGLTSTSANHICNMAKEYYQNIESELDSISFVSEAVQLIGQESGMLIKKGCTDVSEIPVKLKRMAQAKSLIAWLREAIKAREGLMGKVNRLTTEDWSLDNGLEVLEMPEKEKYMTEEEYYDKLPLSERNRYYYLETVCSNLGNYIHQGGKISNARKELKEKINEPNTLKEKGRDTIIYSYKPAVSESVADDLFFGLQQEYREAQAELNKIKFGCQKALEENKIDIDRSYDEKFNRYMKVNEALVNKVSLWKKEEIKRIGSLKIVIPDSLKEIFDEIKSLGKEKK